MTAPDRNRKPLVDIWDHIESLTGETVSRNHRKRGDEVTVVDQYLDSIGHSLPRGITRSSDTDPPDVVTEFKKRVIGVEVARIVNGSALEATKAFHQGKTIPGYDHPERLERRWQRFGWRLTEEALHEEIKRLVIEKSSGLQRWQIPEAEERWLILELRQEDHDREISKVEEWIERAELPTTSFDRIGVVTCFRDPAIKSPRSVTRKS
ncbi:MAG: hypothetical protein AAF367_08395 [Pseudomonadota bacterium]